MTCRRAERQFLGLDPDGAYGPGSFASIQARCVAQADSLASRWISGNPTTKG